jgi:SAM-dependent methyltransferase
MRFIQTESTNCCVCGSFDSLEIFKSKDYQYETTDQVFSWHKCLNCDHLFLNPRPTKEMLEFIYPKNLMNYTSKRSSLGWRIKNRLEIKYLTTLIGGSSKELNILDIGCADGNLLSLIRKNSHVNHNLFGIEISENAIQRLGSDLNISIEIGTVETIDLPNNKFDLVFMQQVIEHVHDPRKTIIKIVKSLKTDGKIIVETPLVDSWDMKLFDKLFPGMWEGYHVPRHFNLWNINNFKRLVEESKGKVVEYKIKTKPVHWTLTLQNYFRSKQLQKISNYFKVENSLFLIIFGVLDFVQVLFSRGSDIRYIIERDSNGD